MKYSTTIQKSKRELININHKKGVNNMNNTNKINVYIIRSLSMANYLIRNGHDMIKVEDSEKDPKLKVFLFEDTPALRKTMKQFRRSDKYDSN